MSRRRSFVYDMFPQDFMSGVVGMPDEVVGVYIKLINLMHMYEGPLPPKSARQAPSEFDEWVRDKLGHKNIRTWRRAKRLLLADADKLVEMPDGRIINPRVARDLAKRASNGQRPPEEEQGGGGGGSGGGSGGAGGGQGKLPLRVVDNPVEPEGQAAASGDDRANIGRCSGDVRSMRDRKSLKSRESPSLYPYPYIRIPLQVAVVGTRCRARPQAGGDPWAARPP